MGLFNAARNMLKFEDGDPQLDGIIVVGDGFTRKYPIRVFGRCINLH